ncbi:MAG: hypothetical protein NTX15_10305 [Candidatus Kapabacteria bacterium]|nr:hypothetical protein [Candidatus Kapabacteria bacterium]
MTSSDKLAISAVKRISVAFDFEENDAVTEHDVLQQIRSVLIERIICLLNANPEKLMAILYRIDVPESIVNEIFIKALPPDVPEMIAELIIERQLAKARTRAEHARPDGDVE